MALFCKRYFLLEDSHQGQMVKQTGVAVLVVLVLAIDRRVQLNCIARCYEPNREFNARAGAGAVQGRHLW